jgi:type IX secretion system substrate protein
MRTIITKTILSGAFILLSLHVFAQEIIVVEPGLGTLNTAIATHGGDAVYQLTAGSWYGLDAIIEASDETLGVGGSLTIIGEETDEMPAMIQVGNDLDGGVLTLLIRAFNDVTLKNLFLIDQDAVGTGGTSLLEIAAPIKLTIDNCVIDPAAVGLTFSGADPGNGTKFYLTNNLLLRNGAMGGPNDPGYMGSNQWDTLYIENNTFVSSGQWLFGGAQHRDPPNNFIWINHNTFLWHDVWLGIPFNDLNYYMTNNIFHDVSLYSQPYAWGQWFQDYPTGNTMMSLANTDTLNLEGGGTESLPSTRVKFWQRNLQYNSPGVKSIAEYNKAADTIAPIYNIPMLWEDDTPDSYASNGPIASPADSSRENRMFNDDVNWPGMKYNHNMYDVDPQYTDAKIYEISDSAGLQALQWFKKYIWAIEGVPEPVDWPSFMWDVDGWAGTDPAYYPVVWPRFDGSYTNPTLLTASTAGLPLGDLNWFPDAKASWLKHQDAIAQHILDLNEDQYLKVGVEQNRNELAFSVYPNPVQDFISIKSVQEVISLRIYSVTGSLFKIIDMSSQAGKDIDVSDLSDGVYLLKIDFVGGGTYSSKIIKE